MLNKTSRSQLISSIYAAHVEYWEAARPDLERYRDIYNINFFRNVGLSKDSSLDIQVADANSFVEGYIASLFSKAPSVRMVKDIKASSGNDKVAEGIANRFLFDQQEVFTRAARLALIFPMSFIKIVPCGKQRANVLDKFSLIALKPWEVILDMVAPDWDSQRWIGHVSYMPLQKAKQLYGNKEWKTEQLKDYFTDTKIVKTEFIPEEYQFIKIIEFYDMASGKRTIWSPNLRDGDIIEEEDIPLMDEEDEPIIPIVPLYLCTQPEQPLKGFSTLKKIYDQIREKNLIRSHWAQSIRRDTRQVAYTKGSLDEEALAKLESGLDNSFIGIDKGQPSQVFSAIPNIPMSSNHQIYLQQVEQDLQRASVLAPFSKGIATNVTATEISALAQYTASEIGKMARVRDAAIEQITLAYIRLVQVFLDEDDTRTVLTIENDLHVLRQEDLDGSFKIVAIDQGSVPLAQEAKRQQFMSLIPVLTGLGVPAGEILSHLGGLFELPDTLTKIPPPPVAPPEASAEASPQEQVPLPTQPLPLS
jgi:hypothetical protein